MLQQHTTRTWLAPNTAAKRTNGGARLSSRGVNPPRCSAAAASSSADAADASSVNGVERRRVLLGGAGASLAAAVGTTTALFGASEASAAELSTVYTDEEDKFSFKVPQDWELATGLTSPNPQSTRRVVAFYPPGKPEINGE